ARAVLVFFVLLVAAAATRTLLFFLVLVILVAAYLAPGAFLLLFLLFQRFQLFIIESSLDHDLRLLAASAALAAVLVRSQTEQRKENEREQDQEDNVIRFLAEFLAYTQEYQDEPVNAGHWDQSGQHAIERRAATDPGQNDEVVDGDESRERGLARLVE